MEEQQPAPQCVVVRRSQIDETLAARPTPGKKLLEPFQSFAKAAALPFKILEDTNVMNEAEVHTHEGDLWLCLEGSVTFVYGGTLVDPLVKKKKDGSVDEREWNAKAIRNGTETVIHAGDWLWIPAGIPHQHTCAGVARLAIMKIPKS